MTNPHSSVTITRTGNGWIVTNRYGLTRLFTEDEALPMLYLLMDLEPVETAMMSFGEFESRLSG